jgi:hypothetical protein
LIEVAILSLLFPDVFPDHGFVSTDRRDEVSPRPEVLACEIADKPQLKEE